jgi:hypothetical protein
VSRPKHFFVREHDGSVRIRIRFQEQEASDIEEAAGRKPLLTWIHDVIAEAAERDIKNRSYADLPPATTEEA